MFLWWLLWVIFFGGFLCYYGPLLFEFWVLKMFRVLSGCFTNATLIIKQREKYYLFWLECAVVFVWSKYGSGPEEMKYEQIENLL